MSTKKRKRVNLEGALERIIETRQQAQTPAVDKEAASAQILAKFKRPPTRSEEDLDQTQIEEKSISIPSRNPIQSRTDTVSEIDTVPYVDKSNKKNTGTKTDTVIKSDTVPDSDTVKGYLRVPNYILDVVFRRLNTNEQVVYLRLFRLSHGWGRDWCLVGLEKLCDSTNIGRTVMRETLKGLQERKLIEALETINTKEIKGTRYKVYTPSDSDTVSESDTDTISETGAKSERVSKSARVLKNDTVSGPGTIKDHDHEDLKIHDHHQKEVMMIYSRLTGNPWTKTDQKSYEQIRHLPVEHLATEIRAIAERSSAPIGSFAYFATSIKNAVAEGKSIGQAGQSTSRRRIEEWATQLRQAHVGDATYSISDLSEDLKNRCAREGVEYSAELINEIISRH